MCTVPCRSSDAACQAAARLFVNTDAVRPNSVSLSPEVLLDLDADDREDRPDCKARGKRDRRHREGGRLPGGRGSRRGMHDHRSPCCGLAFGGVTMVRARTCRLELNQIWRKFRNDPGADRQGYQIGTMQYAQCPRLAVDSAAPVCGVSYRSGFGFGADSLN